MKIKYFDATKFIQENFSHKVQPFQFKNYVHGMISKMSIDKNAMIKDMPKGKNNRTIINIILVPVLAKWVSTKEVKEDKSIDKILYELLIDFDRLEEYKIDDKSYEFSKYDKCIHQPKQ